jgi:hypothetical protein
MVLVPLDMVIDGFNIEGLECCRNGLDNIPVKCQHCIGKAFSILDGRLELREEVCVVAAELSVPRGRHRAELEHVVDESCYGEHAVFCTRCWSSASCELRSIKET